MDPERAAREKAAYDEGTFADDRRRYQSLYRQVYGSPNSLRIKAYWQGLIKTAAPGRRILEIGCGEGWDCRKFSEWGAAEVHGIDLSTVMLDTARRHQRPGLQFFEHDLHEPWPHKYDLIVGRSVLHHLNYRVILSTLYDNNLAPGGQMVFVEPLGQGLLMRIYWRVGGRFHTPDEKPFVRDDIEWLQKRFPDFRLVPMNYSSLPAAGISWALGLAINNPLTRLADRIDVSIAERMPALKLHYRSAVFHIVKPD